MTIATADHRDDIQSVRHPSPGPPQFSMFLPSWGSLRGILVVFLKAGTLSCETPAALENPRKDQEREERMKIVAGEEKERNFGPSHPSENHPSGSHPRLPGPKKKNTQKKSSLFCPGFHFCFCSHVSLSRLSCFHFVPTAFAYFCSVSGFFVPLCCFFSRVPLITSPVPH